jgi:hypothetical protein
MSNLTPEQRPDRNGNIVTRWVKLFKRDRREANHIPAPVATPPQEVPSVDADLMEEACHILQRKDGHKYGLCRTNAKFVITNRPELMRQVLDLCWDDESYKEFWGRRFSNQYVAPQIDHYGWDDWSSVPESLTENKLERVRQALIANDETSRLFTEGDDPNSRYRMMYYFDAAATRLASADPSDQRLRACVLIAYIHGVHHEIFADKLEVPEEQIDYFAENLDRIRMFAPQIRARGTTDIAFVRDMIEDTSAALAEGAL